MDFKTRKGDIQNIHPSAYTAAQHPVGENDSAYHSPRLDIRDVPFCRYFPGLCRASATDGLGPLGLNGVHCFGAEKTFAAVGAFLDLDGFCGESGVGAGGDDVAFDAVYIL